jgi:hypothetical protein
MPRGYQPSSPRNFFAYPTYSSAAFCDQKRS